MDYQDNDTLNAKQQNQSQADKSKNKNQSQADKTKDKDAMTAKMLASAAAGMVAGAGATSAAQHLSADEELPTNEEVLTPGNEDYIVQLTTPIIEERTDEEKDSTREQQGNIRQQRHAEHQRQEPQRQEEEEEQQQKESDEHQQEQEEMQQQEQENGEDNSEEQDVKIEYAEEHTLEVETTAPSVEHEVNVVAVENNEELGGETVNLAVVSIDDQPVMFVDRDQNGEVDLAVADRNNDGNIDPDEVQDISSSHITMPTTDVLSDNTMMASTSDSPDEDPYNTDAIVYEA